MKPIDRGTWLALVAMGVAVFVIANDFSAINVAIRRSRRTSIRASPPPSGSSTPTRWSSGS